MLSPGDRSAIQQQQQQLLDENQRQRDALERSAPLTITPSPETSAGTEGPCFTVSRIVVSGATRLTSAETDRLVAPWVNQCLNITGLTAVTDAVTDGYIRRGYITSRAFLTEQDLSGGVLHITVMEGRLQQIRAEGADLPGRTLKMVFPGMEGKVLNLRDIEQGMEQINRLRTEPVQIEISPGDREGWSVVTLTVSPEWPVTGSVGIDNSGQKNTGTGQLNGVLSFNNPLGLADNWFVSGGRSSDFSVSHDARNFAAGVSLPYGYTLVDYTYSWSDYLSTIDNRGWRWRSTGDLQTHRLGLSHVLFRNGNMKTALTGGLQHRIIHNYLDDVLLQGSSRKLTSFSVGLNHTHKFLGGVGTLNPVFTRGMPWFGAESDHGKRGDLPVNQFRKWSVSASFQRPVTDRVWWLTSAYAQWSPDRLHGVEQLSLGGESSVRGFKEQYISGNNGGYLRNELSWSLFSLPYVGTVRAVTALDGGWLHSDRDDLYSSGTLWGADLLVNYHTFSNSGTLLGTSGLGVKGSSLLQNGTGRLYSAGNLLLDAQDFSGQGQVVATGDVTLKLIAALTNHGTLAAGKTLSVTSQNAITNGGVMQGDAMVLGAGEAFTNNGTLTAGKGNSVFSAQRLFLNAPGSLQGGGDVSLNSRSDITISGFTGTAGSLTMNVAGTLLNSALIYAGNNLKLFTDRLHNQHGDILAGNSLWVQKDASGGANTEIINTSGNIETHQGDIVVRTGHLLNQREGFSATTTTRTNPSSIQ